MNKPRDRLDFFLPTNKFHVFLICFVVPLLAVWLLFGGLSVIFVATNDGEARGPLHPFVSNPYLSGLVFSFRFAFFVGFSTWLFVLIRHKRWMLWSYFVLVWFWILLESDDWLSILRFLLLMAPLLAVMGAVMYLIKRVTRIPRVPEPSLANFLASGESVLMKCVARDERGVSGWLFVTTASVLYVESPAPIQSACVSIPLSSIVLAKPGWTNGPDEVTVDTSTGSRTFEVDEGLDLVMLINERKDFSARRI